ncbi:dihydrodipicolinate synthase family protein [Halobacteria archaeon AArc-dxtr1]|nr:dihydrodipicolinate synthase family protein [Halobacteria archaeon AArc-dxtr1]
MDFRTELAGITCPIVTPFEPDPADIDSSDPIPIDEAALESLVDSLIQGGIDALFPCGTAGEFASLSAEERRRVTELTVSRADGAVPVVAGAAATSVSETLGHVHAAVDVGADAAVVVPPYFHTANDPAGNRRFFEAVADESPLPLLLYNIPQCSGDPIDLDTLEAVATHENVLGLKDSGGDFEYFLSAIRRTPADFLTLQGFDSLLVPSLRMGADGGVNGLSNVAPAVYAELFETADERRGRRLQDAIAPLFETTATYGFAPAAKAALAYRGTIPSDAVRPPLVPVPGTGRETIGSRLDALLEA